MKKTKCRSCGAPIFWAKTEGNKNIPIDLEPVEDGNIGIRSKDLEESRNPIARVIDWKWSGKRFVSHFVTCPQAKRWRKDK